MDPHPNPVAPPLTPGDRAAADIPVAVVLVEPHVGMRRSLTSLLATERGIDVIVETGDLSSARLLFDHRRPDVLVLDLSLISGPGETALRELRRIEPGLAVVALTMQESAVFAERAISVGAIGFVLKQAADTELAPAILSAARGETYRSDYAARRYAAQLSRNTRSRVGSA